MTTFDERDKGFENKFAHDEEFTFKIHARRNKLLGLWAAAKMGKSGDEATTYAKDVVLVEFDSAGSHDVAEKLLKDFKQAGVDVMPEDIEKEMGQLLMTARKELMGEE